MPYYLVSKLLWCVICKQLFQWLSHSVEEDIKLNSQTFNWPGRMDPIFEVSQQRLSARREKAENEVKER